MKMNKYSTVIFKILGGACSIILLLLTYFVIEKDVFGDLYYFYVILLIVVSVIFIMVTFTELRANHNESSIINKLHKVIKGNLNTRIYIQDKGLKATIATRCNELIELLHRNEERYRSLEESRKRLLSNISHDIRTPLTSIIGYVDAIKDGIPVDDKEEEEYLDIISNKSRKLKSLIDEIFLMTKLDADDVPMDFDIYDLGEIIRECIIEFLPQINKDNIKMVINITQERLPVYVDKLRISRGIENLIKNSITHGKKGNILGIDVTILDKSYQVVIWDRGLGIPKEEIKHVFDRLYIGDKTRKRRNGGSGLGLAITKKLIEKHRGTIWVNSASYEKTEFIFTLPKL